MRPKSILIAVEVTRKTPRSDKNCDPEAPEARVEQVPPSMRAVLAFAAAEGPARNVLQSED
jgi:hypothetical protein